MKVQTLGWEGQMEGDLKRVFVGLANGNGG